MTTWVLLGLVVVLVLACGVFVAAEFSLVTIDRASVAEEAKAGDPSAQGIQNALRTLSTQLSGAQIGITLTSLVIGFLAEPAIAQLLQGPLESLGVPASSSLAIALAAALLIATVAQMLFSELIPKNWAISQPRRVAGVVTPPMRAFTAAVAPLIRLTNGNANWLLRRMGIEPVEELASARSAQELQYLVRHSGQSGTLPQATATLIDRSLRFGEREAEDVMTPRTRVVALDGARSAQAVLQMSQETGLSRFPVVRGGDTDEVIGVVTLRDVLRVPAERRGATQLTSVMSEAVTVPETLPLQDVLPLVRSGSHLVVVVDEYGGTAGVVTLEDLVEELVGEVADEHDRESFQSLRQIDGRWLLSGTLRPEQARELGIDLPDGTNYETVAGLVLAQLGRIAEVGDVVSIGEWTLTVQTLDGLRIDLITASRADAAEVSERG